MKLGSLGTARDSDVSSTALPRLLRFLARALAYDCLFGRGAGCVAPAAQRALSDAPQRFLALNLVLRLLGGDAARLALAPSAALESGARADAERAALRCRLGGATGLSEFHALAGACSALARALQRAQCARARGLL